MIKSNNEAILRKEKNFGKGNEKVFLRRCFVIAKVTFDKIIEKYAKNTVLAKSIEKFLLVKNLLQFNKDRKIKRQ